VALKQFKTAAALALFSPEENFKKTKIIKTPRKLRKAITAERDNMVKTG
jgi:hypothetical protein